MHYSCSWNGFPCDMDRMWRSVFTDVGVCYSFNSVDDLFATKTGKNDRTEDIFSHLFHLLPVVSHAKVHLLSYYDVADITFHCTFRDSSLATSIYGHMWTELDSMPVMHPTVINLSNSNIIIPCVVFFLICIVPINLIYLLSASRHCDKISSFYCKKQTPSHIPKFLFSIIT